MILPQFDAHEMHDENEGTAYARGQWKSRKIGVDQAKRTYNMVWGGKEFVKYNRFTTPSMWTNLPLS